MSAYAVSLTGDKLLVLLGRHKRYDVWLPLGGEIEPNETPLEAMMREVKEEAGLDPSQYKLPTFGEVPGILDGGPFAPSGFLLYEEHEAGSKGLHMNFVFVLLVSQHRGAIKPCQAEFGEMRWFDPSSRLDVVLPKNVLSVLGRLELMKSDFQQWESRGCRELLDTDPIGTEVDVVLDNGRVWRTKTRSEMWKLGSGDWVVKLEGYPGVFAAERCTVQK